MIFSFETKLFHHTYAKHRLEPEWRAAAADVKDQAGDAVKLGALDATAHQSTASKYGVC